MKDSQVFLKLSFCVAARISLYVSVYVLPLEVLGSTLIKTSSTEIVRISVLTGYLNDRDGP